MRKLIIVLSFLICLYSCKVRIKDYGGYILSENPEYGENLIITYSDTSAYHHWDDGTSSLQKGVFLKYISKNKIDTAFICEESTVIEACINDIDCDSDFIIVDQKPLDSIWGPIVNIDSTPRRKKHYDNADEAINYLKKRKIHDFWIIDKKKKDVYGPMQKHEFEKKREELKIPKGLTLKDSPSSF
jgi:Protein of unknown function (DUF3997)